VLSVAEREELVRWARGAVPDKAAQRAAIVLACADGASNAQVAADLAVTTATVGKWRARFARDRLEGLRDGGRSGRPKADLVLSPAEREQLTRWARRAKTSQDLALRAKIVLRCADGVDNAQVARELAVTAATVNRWRARFVAQRLDGLADDPRPGRPPVIRSGRVEEVIAATLETAPPDGAARWSRTAMAEATGLSPSTVGRIWRRFDLKPHLQDGFTLAADPRFAGRVVDVAGLYHSPPQRAVALCVERAGRVPALDRYRPAAASAPGTAERRAHDRLCGAVATLFAALPADAADTAPSAAHRRRGAAAFKRFLAAMDKTVPADLDVHLVCDDHGTHKATEIGDWLARHPRFHVHFTPAGSSWTHLVERWFGAPAGTLGRRGAHQSIRELGGEVTDWVATRDRSPRPFVWTKTTEEIAQSLAAFLTTGSPGARSNQQRT
jgi:transposase